MNTMRLRSILVVLAIAAALPACRSKSDGPSQEITAESMPEQGVLTEQHDSATVVWSVARDGQVKVLVRTPDGKPIDKGVSGSITVKGEGPEGALVELPLVPDPKTGMLIGLLPKLEADLTEMSYQLDVNGKPIQGTLHIPPGGTAELEANAKLAAKVKLPEGKKGPNGGVVQVVGDDVVEIVADKSSGNTRVYVLDDDLKPIPVGERTVKLAVVSTRGPEIVAMAPEPGGLYFTGRMSAVVNPMRVTVGLTYRGETDVVLCGYHPGAVVVVGAAAPVLPVLVDVSWGVGVDVGVGVGVAVGAPVIVVDGHPRWKGKGKGKGKWRGKRGADVHIHVH